MPSKFDDFKPAFKALVPVMAKGHAAAIRSRGALLGTPWPAPDPEYVTRKRGAGGGNAQMILTKHLWTEATRTGGRSVLSLTKRKVSVGVKSVPYARSLQFKRRFGFIGWTEHSAAKSTQILDDHARRLYQEASEAAGGGQ